METLAAKIDGFGLYDVPSSRRQQNCFLSLFQVLANLLALAAICPFVGSLSDLLGRRYVALTGALFIILGSVISSTAQTMNIFICK